MVILWQLSRTVGPLLSPRLKLGFWKTVPPAVLVGPKSCSFFFASLCSAQRCGPTPIPHLKLKVTHFHYLKCTFFIIPIYLFAIGILDVIPFKIGIWGFQDCGGQARICIRFQPSKGFWTSLFSWNHSAVTIQTNKHTDTVSHQTLRHMSMSMYHIMVYTL